jgi:hypothetical protein
MRGQRVKCRVQNAECRVQSAGDGTPHLTVGGAELKALSAHATYQNVNFVNCDLLGGRLCSFSNQQKTPIRPDTPATERTSGRASGQSSTTCAVS